MEDVSDPPFRALCKENGADVVYTEFISSEGLIRDAAKSVIKLDIYEKERPVGIQIFGANLDSMLQAVDIVEKSNPDIIDINYGCPVKKVVSKGAGAGILKDICLMESLTKAIVERTSLPVTVKTRLGWDNDSIKISIRFLSNEISADALKINVFSKECEKSINCKVAQSNPKIENELKIAILKRAAKYKKDMIDANPKRDLNSILSPGDKN